MSKIPGKVKFFSLLGVVIYAALAVLMLIAIALAGRIPELWPWVFIAPLLLAIGGGAFYGAVTGVLELFKRAAARWL